MNNCDYSLLACDLAHPKFLLLSATGWTRLCLARTSSPHVSYLYKPVLIAFHFCQTATGQKSDSPQGTLLYWCKSVAQL